MTTGYTGTFVISWSQTVIDGLKAAPMDALTTGCAWAWSGEPVRIDGPTSVLRLAEADSKAQTRRHAARAVRQLVGAAIHGQRSGAPQDALPGPDDDPVADCTIVVTDGRQSFTLTVIPVAKGMPPLLMVMGNLPRRDQDYWVVDQNLDIMTQTASADPARGGVICFTPGTRIDTPRGRRPVEELQEGDQVLTRDNGPQEIRWIGSRRMTGARLFALPALRPIRLRAGVLGMDRPDRDLLVSPDHRMLIRGDRTRALFNTAEVLVTARDLVDGDGVIIDSMAREVTYIHLMLPSHQVIWANGVESESFHPAHAGLHSLTESDRARLLALHPGLETNPQGYGAPCRRLLSPSEAALLHHAA